MLKMKTFLVLFAGLLFAAAVTAQEDDPSVKDHPGIPRFPGTVISGGTHNDFSAHEFDLGEGKMKRVEGKYWTITYSLKEGAKVPGPLEVARNYGNQFKKRGGKVLMEQVSSGGGQALMKMPGSEGGEVWLELVINNSGEQLIFTIVAEAPMEQKVELTADAMAGALASSGRIALYGILFDTGKDVIKPESALQLAEIARLLTGNGALKLRIEGHTDNIGKAADNAALSTKRAMAVKNWLIAKGIAAMRLETAGLGDSKSVAPNSNDEGRAKNRRVELVKL